MKSDRIQTAGIVVAAMIAGSVLTWYLARNGPQQQPSTAPAPSSIPHREAISTIKPPGIHPEIAERAVPLDDDALEKAVAAAKAARRAGTLAPLAATPEGFAKVLGKWNFAIHDFSRRFPSAPEENAPEHAAYRKELDQLTNNLANLLSDEELMTRLDVETPAQRARYQANLAIGSLELDAAAATKLETLLSEAYGELSAASSVDAAALEKKVEGMNAKILAELDALLTPEQRARLNSMGVDRVFLGHGAGEE